MNRERKEGGGGGGVHASCIGVLLAASACTRCGVIATASCSFTVPRRAGPVGLVSCFFLFLIWRGGGGGWIMLS